MGKFIDMTGWIMKEHGVLDSRWTILEYAGNSKWKCQCECGEIKEVRGPDLKSGRSKSCGCIHSELLIQRNLNDNPSKAIKKDLTNQRFGSLLVLEEMPDRQKTKVIWKCQCDCGNITYSKTSELLRGTRHACGVCSKGISKGELKISIILSQNNIPFKREYALTDLKSSKNVPRRMDFAIFDKEKIKYFIEYQGIQHYEDIDYFRQSLEEIQRADKEKKEYCKNKNIPLIIIPYSDYNILDMEYINKAYKSYDNNYRNK